MADNKTGGKKKHAIIFKNTGNPYGEKEMEGFKIAITELGGEPILKHLINLLLKHKLK